MTPEAIAFFSIASTLGLFAIINRVRAVLAWKASLDNVVQNITHLERNADLTRDNLRRDIRDTDAEVRKTRDELLLQVNTTLQGERAHTDAVVKQLREMFNAWREEVRITHREFRNTFETIGGVHSTTHQAIEKLESKVYDLDFRFSDLIKGVQQDREDLNLLAGHLHVGFKHKFSTRELVQTLTEKQTR